MRCCSWRFPPPAPGAGSAADDRAARDAGIHRRRADPDGLHLIITCCRRPSSRSGLALFALSATFAPAIGPTIGGYLTENWGWQYIFYVNLVPGALMMAMLWFSLEPGPMKLAAAPGRLAGIATMAIGLARCRRCSRKATRTTGSARLHRPAVVIAAIALALFLWIELTSKKPLLNLRLLARRNFGFGSLANFLLGVALYGSVFILPSICRASRATIPSRSAWCWPGPGCRNWC
jgi:DHA2 family multidrug resistance protein